MSSENTPGFPGGVRAAIAANIRAERARARLSQQAVADGMRDYGYISWYPQTAGQVERGSRPVHADELIALAGVLGTAPDTLWRVTPSNHMRKIGADLVK